MSHERSVVRPPDRHQEFLERSVRRQVRDLVQLPYDHIRDLVVERVLAREVVIDRRRIDIERLAEAAHRERL